MLYRITTFVFLALFSISALADLLVSPTRIVFDDRDRVKEVILINTSNITRSYRVEWNEKTVSKSGSYIDLADETPEFALSPFMRFSPRQVTLKAGERQVVKLLLRRKNEMNSDEYRSHLRFFALPIQREVESQNQVDGMELRLDILTSYTIPVIFRTTNTVPTINIESVAVTPDSDEKANIMVTISKNGSTSVTGSLYAYIDDPDTGKKLRIGELNSVTLFHESQLITFRVMWQNFQKFNAYRGSLQIEYVGAKEFSGTTFDQQALAVEL